MRLLPSGGASVARFVGLGCDRDHTPDILSQDAAIRSRRTGSRQRTTELFSRVRRLARRRTFGYGGRLSNETLDRRLEAMAIRPVVWGEKIHDRENAVVRGIYPKGMHGAIAEALNEDGAIKASTATMEEPEHGLPEARLAATDV